MNKKGFASIVIILIVGFLAIGGSIWYWKVNQLTPVPYMPTTQPIVQQPASSSTQSNKCEPERKKFWLKVDNIHTLVINKSDVSCAVAKPEEYSDFLFKLMSMGKSQGDLLGYLTSTKFAVESYKKAEEQSLATINSTDVSKLSNELHGLADKISDESDRTFAEQIITNIQKLLPLLSEYHQNCSALYTKDLERGDLDFKLVSKEISRDEYDRLVEQKNKELSNFIEAKIKPIESPAWVLKNTLWDVYDRLLPQIESEATQQINAQADPYKTPLGPLLREFEKVPLYSGMVEDKSASADTTGEACTFQEPEVFRYFKSNASPSDVAAFYDEELPKLGWEKKQYPYYTWRWEKDNFMFVITPPNREMNNLVNEYIFELSLKDAM